MLIIQNYEKQLDWTKFGLCQPVKVDCKTDLSDIGNRSTYDRKYIKVVFNLLSQEMDTKVPASALRHCLFLHT